MWQAVRWAFALTVFTVGNGFGTLPSAAQDYPSRVATIIVPVPAGGPLDHLGRLLAQRFTATFNQNFIVENVSGGATLVGTGRVARANPDGYTLLMQALQISSSVSLYPKLNFDIEKDLTPVGFLTQNPLVLVGRKSLAPSSLVELIAWMKTTPAKFAHPGNGSTGHLATALFAQEADVKVDHIPYRGSAPAMQDLVGGHVDLFFAAPLAVLELAKTGQIKVFGVTSSSTSPSLLNAPSIVEVLGPKLEISFWQALFAPAKTPQSVIDRLNGVVREMMDDSAVLKVLNESAISPYPANQRSPQAAQALFRAEVARWAQVVRDNNIQPSNE